MDQEREVHVVTMLTVSAQSLLKMKISTLAAQQGSLFAVQWVNQGWVVVPAAVQCVALVYQLTMDVVQRELCV